MKFNVCLKQILVNCTIWSIIPINFSETIKEWQAQWKHKNYKNLNFDMQMTVLEKPPDATKINSLVFSVDKETFPILEVEPLIENCSDTCDPTFFFKLIEDYWQKHLFRIQFIQDQELQSQFNKNTGAYRVIFKGFDQPLAQLQWTIQFDKLAGEFIESYVVAFSEQGRKSIKFTSADLCIKVQKNMTK